MPTDDKVLRNVERKDHEGLAALELSPTEIGLVQSYWYEAYVAELKAEGRRFPGTAKDIAIAAFGREKDRQILYKNPHIKVKHPKNLKEIGQDARSKKVEKTPSVLSSTDRNPGATLSRNWCRA